MRKKLIYIIDMYGINNDWMAIAQESDEELLDRVHSILEHYFNENQII
jgi:hypothetical protein